MADIVTQIEITVTSEIAGADFSKIIARLRDSLTDVAFHVEKRADIPVHIDVNWKR